MANTSHFKRRVPCGRVLLGDGMPKICVPLMGKSPQEMRALTDAAVHSGADVLEWRIDALSPLPTPDRLQPMHDAVRASAGTTPLLMTLRTARDGGSGSADPAAYEQLLCALARARLCDALDVEWSAGRGRFERIVQAAHDQGLCVVGSSHDFSGTPDEQEITSRLFGMESSGADVCKIAVMPHNRRDVLTLMQACISADEQLEAPLIAIAMGPLGVITRIGGAFMGSCLTFGTAGQASAPGQIDTLKLRAALEVFHA